MANQTVTTELTLNQVIANGLTDGDSITINSGGKVTMTETNSVLIDRITINSGEFHIDGTNISAGNCIQLIGEYNSLMYAHGQGIFRTTGAWFDLGTTDGTSHQVIDLSTYWGGEFEDVIPMIQVETGRRISFTGASGVTPEVDDWLHVNGDRDPVGRIIEVGADYLILKYAIYPIADTDALQVRKVVDYMGPDYQLSWTATANGADIKEAGVYQEFGNCSTSGIAGLSYMPKKLGGFCFDNIYQSNSLTLGGTTGGWTPPAGCNIRVPNINIATSNSTEFSLGNTYCDGTTNEGTAWNISTGNGGEVYLHTSNSGSAWIGAYNAYRWESYYTGSNDELGSSSSSNKTIYHNCVVCQGLIGDWFNTNYAFRTLDLLFGAELKECMVVSSKHTRKHLGAETSPNIVIENCIVVYGSQSPVLGTATHWPFRIIRCRNVSLNNNIIVSSDIADSDGSFYFSGCVDVTMSNTWISGTIDYTKASHQGIIGTFASDNANWLVTGIQFLGNGVWGDDLFSITDCTNMRFRNIGAIDHKIDCSPSPGDYMFYIGGFTSDIDIARCWKKGGGVEEFVYISPTVRNVLVQNCSGDYASELQATGGDNISYRGLHAASANMGSTTGLETDLTATYGVGFNDCFRSDTTGGITLNFTPKTVATDSMYVITAGNPLFSRDGDLDIYAGDVIEYTMPYLALGHTSLTGVITTSYASGSVADGTDEWGSSYVTVEFQYDTGSGFNGTWLDLRVPSNLTSIANTVTGIRFKIRLTGLATREGLNGLMIHTTTTLQDQIDNYYPIDQIEYTLSLSGVVSGSDLVVLEAGTSNVLFALDQGSNNFDYVYNTLRNVDIGVLKPGYVPFYIYGYTLGEGDVTIPVAQIVDRAYHA